MAFSSLCKKTDFLVKIEAGTAVLGKENIRRKKVSGFFSIDKT